MGFYRKLINYWEQKGNFKAWCIHTMEVLSLALSDSECFLATTSSNFCSSQSSILSVIHKSNILHIVYCSFHYNLQGTIASEHWPDNRKFITQPAEFWNMWITLSWYYNRVYISCPLNTHVTPICNALVHVSNSVVSGQYSYTLANNSWHKTTMTIILRCAYSETVKYNFTYYLNFQF